MAPVETTVCRHLLLLAVLCGLTWAGLILAALEEGETRTMAGVRTGAGLLVIALVAWGRRCGREGKALGAGPA